MIKRGPIIAGAVALVAIILVVVVLVMPRRSEVAAKTEELAQAEAKQSELQIQLANLETLQEQAPQFQRQLDENELLVPKLADIPGLIRTLDDVADNTGTDFAVLSVSTPTTISNYSMIALGITSSGRLDQVARYLYDVENLDRAVKVTSINLAPSGGIVNVSMTAEVYTTDVSSGPGTPPGSDSAADVAPPPVEEVPAEPAV